MLCAYNVLYNDRMPSEVNMGEISWEPRLSLNGPEVRGIG